MSNKGNKHGRVTARLLFSHFTTLKKIKNNGYEKRNRYGYGNRING